MIFYHVAKRIDRSQQLNFKLQLFLIGGSSSKTVEIWRACEISKYNEVIGFKYEVIKDIRKLNKH